MDVTNFLTENGFEYQYLPKHKSIILNDSRLLDKSYYQKRERFFRDKVMIDSFQPKLNTSYSPEAIESNLANLRMLLLEVTDGCNLACEYCGYGKLYNNYDKRTNKKNDYKTIKALIDYLYKLWLSPLNVSYNNNITIGFYGGEPLLSFDLIKRVILYIENLDIDSVKFQYNMTTNAMLLDRYMDYLVEKNFSLLLSLDGNKFNNSYRITENGKESFNKIVRNIKQLRQRYPSYFEEKVNFNSVLHNKNNEEEIISFIRNEFGKIPRIAALNPNGIDESKIDEFYKLFRNRDFINIEKNDNSIDSDLIGISTHYASLSSFYDAFLSNTFNSYTELFSNLSENEYIPTGTCHPFSRKIFLTVNGKILPCERIGHNEPLGYIIDEQVQINFKEVADLYSKKYNQILHQCKKCINWNNCSYCVFHIKERKGGKLICDRFRADNITISYCSQNISLLENNPLLFNELIKRTYKI